MHIPLDEEITVDLLADGTVRDRHPRPFLVVRRSDSTEVTIGVVLGLLLGLFLIGIGVFVWIYGRSIRFSYHRRRRRRRPHSAKAPPSSASRDGGDAAAPSAPPPEEPPEP